MKENELKKTPKIALVLIFIILFFLVFVPIIKVDTPINYWDSEVYARIAAETEELFSAYASTFSASDSLQAKMITVNIFENDYCISVFKIAGRGYRARKSKVIGLLKANDCQVLFPENTGDILLTADNYELIIALLKEKVQAKN